MIQLKNIDWCQQNAQDLTKVDIQYWNGCKETVNANWDSFKSKIETYWKEHGREEWLRI